MIRTFQHGKLGRTRFGTRPGCNLCSFSKPSSRGTQELSANLTISCHSSSTIACQTLELLKLRRPRDRHVDETSNRRIWTTILLHAYALQPYTASFQKQMVSSLLYPSGSVQDFGAATAFILIEAIRRRIFIPNVTIGILRLNPTSTNTELCNKRLLCVGLPSGL